MKRSLEPPSTAHDPRNMKKLKVHGEEHGGGGNEEGGLVNLDENLVFEVLKHVDARTLAASACVSKLWHRTAQDERLWELICTRHWANLGCANHQLRSVVLALGGFQRLHSLYIWPLSNPNPQSSSAWPKPTIPIPKPKPTTARWGKDEVHLSLSLLSIRFYEKMTSAPRNR